MAAIHQITAQAALKKTRDQQAGLSDPKDAKRQKLARAAQQSRPAEIPKGWTGWLYRFIEHRWFGRFILGIILLNAAALGLETIPRVNAQIGSFLRIVDHWALWIFVVELTLKLLVYRLRFFTNGWNLFDLAIVGLAFVPSSSTSILRALRVLRVLRLISAVPSLRVVVQALVSAVPSMTTVIGLLMLFFYVFGVMATRLYAEAMPDKFGSLGQTFLTLFQLMIMDGWADVIRGLMAMGHTTSPIFFIVFVVISGFAVLNLFIGILVNAMDRAESMDHMLHPEDYSQEDEGEKIDRLSQQIEQMQALLETLSQQHAALLDANGLGKMPPASALDSGQQNGQAAQDAANQERTAPATEEPPRGEN